MKLAKRGKAEGEKDAATRTAEPATPPREPFLWILEEITPPQSLPIPASHAQQRDGDTVYPPQPFFDRRVNAKNPLWAGFRPRWLMEAEKTVRIAPVNFQHYRAHVLCMSLDQCAAFLRVDASTIAKWEAGLEVIPYADYMALRLVGDLQFLPHQLKAWADWRIVGAGPDVGMLLDSRTGEMFSPGEISTMRYAYAQASSILMENQRLKHQLEVLQAEMQRLRSLRQIDGVSRELEDMRERMSTLLNDLNQGALTNINQGAFARQVQEVVA